MERLVCNDVRSRRYPIICSTAARTCMRLVKSSSFKSSLQFLCCVELRKLIPMDKHVLDEVNLPPGLYNSLKNSLDWLLRPYPTSAQPADTPSGTTKRPIDGEDDNSDSSDCKKNRTV